MEERREKYQTNSLKPFELLQFAKILCKSGIYRSFKVSIFSFIKDINGLYADHYVGIDKNVLVENAFFGIMTVIDNLCTD